MPSTVQFPFLLAGATGSVLQDIFLVQNVASWITECETSASRFSPEDKARDLEPFAVAKDCNIGIRESGVGEDDDTINRACSLN